MGEYKLIVRVDCKKHLSPAQRQLIRELVVDFIDNMDAPGVPEVYVVNSKFLNVDWENHGKTK